MPSASLRGLLWGIDGIALIVGTVLLALHHFRRENDGVAAGFLIFAGGETLILAGSGMDLAAGAPLFGAGAGLWAAGSPPVPWRRTRQGQAGHQCAAG